MELAETLQKSLCYLHISLTKLLIKQQSYPNYRHQSCWIVEAGSYFLLGNSDQSSTTLNVSNSVKFRYISKVCMLALN